MTNDNQKTRGKPKQYTDEQLKQIALDIKYQLGGVKVTYSLLEKKTGISRNTFQRNISDFITEINTPIIRELEISDKDSVYFPNFEKIYEAFGHDPKRLISEIRSLEATFYEVFDKLIKTNKQLEELNSYKDQLDNLQSDLKKYKEQANFYKNLYESTVVSSLYADKRKELGLETVLIDFKDHVSKNSSLRKLEEMFRDIAVTSDVKIEDSNRWAKIKAKYSNLFNDDESSN